MENSGVLVVALCQRGKLSAAVYELLSAGRALADALSQKLTAVLPGSGIKNLAAELVERGADQVFVIDHAALADFNDEAHAAAVATLAAAEKSATLLLPSSVAGRALAAGLSVRLKAGLVVDASEILPDGSGLRAKRSQYSGNLVSEVEFKTPVRVLTLQPMSFVPAEKKAGRSGDIKDFPFSAPPARVEFVSFKPEETNEIDLGAATRIVSGGRGLGGPEGFKPLRELAHLIGAAVGASRAVVDSGWIAYRHQVGLTGRTVRPQLYIACGISGQIQHLAGMSSAQTIVAINNDPSCPLMQMANISVVADLGEFIPLLIAEIKKRRGG